MILAAVTLLFLSSSFAQDYAYCEATDPCTCPSKEKIALPTKVLLKDSSGTVVRCDPFNPDVKSFSDSNLRETCEENETLLNFVSSFPQGCDYVLRKFDARAFRQTVAHFLESQKVLCGGKHHSMCTSAVFLAILAKAKKLKEQGGLSEKEFAQWTDLKGPVWSYLNDQARPDLLVKNLNLGEGKVLRKKEIPDKDWPKKGDIVQFWRNDNSGHVTVFESYLYDSKEEVIGICFWSSNLLTKGYGKTCEPIANIDRVIIGRLTK